MTKAPETRPKQGPGRKHHVTTLTSRASSMDVTQRVGHLKKALASAAWHIHSVLFGAGRTPLRPFTLTVKVVVHPGSRWMISAEPSLEEQISSAVKDMVSQLDVYRSGRMYCYRCESSNCPHSVPSTPTGVFSGYAPTGVPEWHDFLQVLLTLHHPTTDKLFDAPPTQIVAAYIDPDTLKHRQLTIFGKLSKTYDILGQVVFGFLYLRPSGPAKDLPERVAFSVQAVESRHVDGSPRLEMNILGRMPDGSAAAEALAHSRYVRIFNILAQGRRRIALIGTRLSSSGDVSCQGPEISAEVTRILKDMAKALERVGRQKERRTVHAEVRSTDRRPTSQALADAAEATDEHMLWDERRNTVVVWGPRNRVHIFSPHGRHITSMSLEADVIRNRIKRGRWRQLSDEMLEHFRALHGSRSA